MVTVPLLVQLLFSAMYAASEDNGNDGWGAALMFDQGTGITAGLAYDDLLSGLNFRKRKKIIEALNGAYKEITFNQAIHDSLISLVMDKFNVVSPEEEEEKSFSDEFVKLEEDAVLPWEE